MDKRLIIFIIITIAILVAIYFFFFKSNSTTPSSGGIVDTIKTTISNAIPSNNTGINNQASTSGGIVPATTTTIQTNLVPKTALAIRDGVKVYDSGGTLKKTVARNMWIGNVTSVVGNCVFLVFTDGSKGYMVLADAKLTY